MRRLICFIGGILLAPVNSEAAILRYRNKQKSISAFLNKPSSEKNTINPKSRLQKSLRSLIQELDSALAQSEKIKTAIIDSKLARQRIMSSRASMQPTLSVNTDIGRAHTIERSFETPIRDVNVIYKVPILDLSTSGTLDSLEQENRAQASSLDWEKSQLVNDILVALMNLAEAEEVLALSKQYYASFQEFLQASADKYRSGNISSTEYSRAETRNKKIHADVLGNQARLESRKEEYTLLTNRAPPGNVLLLDLQDMINHLSAKDFQMIERRSDIVSLKAREIGYDKSIDAIRAGFWPQLDFVASVESSLLSGGRLRNTDVNLFVTMSYPIPIDDRISSRVRETLLSKQRVQSRLADAVIGVKNRIKLQENRIRLELQSTKTLQDALISAFQTQRNLVVEQQMGKIDIQANLEARSEVILLQESIVKSRYEVLSAQYAILYELGVLSPQFFRYLLAEEGA